MTEAVCRDERKWLWGVAALVILLTTLPYFLGYQFAGADWRYTGYVFGVEDGNSYIAKMLTGASGDWLFRTPYTAYPQNGFLGFFPYLLLGKLTAPPGEHEQLVALFHLFRLVGISLFIFATYDFLAFFVNDRRWRRLGTVLATLGGGLGWLSVIGLGGLWGQQLPLDFYSPESFGFLMVYGLPHLAVARALLLWAMLDYLRPGPPLSGWRAALKTGLLWLGIGLMQPLTIISGWAVIGAHIGLTGLAGLWKQRAGEAADWPEWRRFFLRALVTGLLSMPMAVYSFLSFRLDSFLSGWEGQNLILSPAFTHYLLGFALVLPLALLGIRPLLREKAWQGWLVVGWVAVFPLLAYAPYNLQRRLPEGIWVALLVLGMKGIETARPSVQRWAPRGLALSFLTTLFLLLGGALAVVKPAEPLFRPAAEVQAFQYLAGNAHGGAGNAHDGAGNTHHREIVLASFNTGNALPAWAYVRTLVGLGTESINGEQLKQRIACFYSPGCSDAERVSLLRETSAHYVFWGPAESALGNWDPAQAAYLKLVYDQAGYRIFEYLPSSQQ